MTARPGRPLRVVHVVSGDQWAGAEVMAFHLLSALAEQGDVAVTAICLNDATLAQNLRGRGIDVHVLDEKTLSFFGLLREGTKLLKHLDADLFHTHRYKEHMLGAYLRAKTAGARLIGTIHGLPEPTRKQVRQALRTRSTFSLLRYGFDGVVAVSEELRVRLLARQWLQPHMTHLVHNGIPIPEVPERSAAARPLHVGSVGRLTPVKDYGLFLEVAAGIRRQVADVTFSLLGGGPERESLLGKARGLGLGDSFTIEDQTPDPSPYYQSLDLYLNTSHSEGLPMSLLEAMAHRVPVVAPAIGGMPEVVRQDADGLLVPRDRGALVDACVRLLRDAALRAQFSRSARARVVEEFSAASMAQRYTALYHHVLGGSRVTVPA